MDMTFVSTPPTFVATGESSTLDMGTLRVHITPGSFAGMVHYDAPTATYFAGLPLCSANLLWPAFIAARTLASLGALCPCKVRQQGRSNDVYLHFVELGIDFSEQTAVAFYKTSDGRNRLAYLRTGNNAAVINIVAKTGDFDVRAITEKMLIRLPLNFQSSNMTMAWVGDVFTYNPPEPRNRHNITIIEPDPRLGFTIGNYTLQYPITAILLRFPGVYTIVEDSLQLRRNGKTTRSRAKRYVTVRKRIAPTTVSGAASVLTIESLKHVQLVNIRHSEAPRVRIPTDHVQSLTVDVNAITANLTSREEELWQRLSKQTQRSCQVLIPSLQRIHDMQEQYTHLFHLLYRDGPCAPGVQGYDLLQESRGDNSNREVECMLMASTAVDTGRHSVLVIQREYTLQNEENKYLYSAQYPSPALVHDVFSSTYTTSLCNVHNLLQVASSVADAVSLSVVWIPAPRTNFDNLISHNFKQSATCV